MIEVRNLYKYYGNSCALNDVSFTARQGEILGLLGPNGAGKTTCMNVITGYMAAHSGTVKIASYDILDQPLQAKSCLGYLPEQVPLYPDMSVRDYLCHIAELKVLKKNQIKKEVERCLFKLGLTEVEKRLIHNLSKGYKQRLGIAQSLLGSPPVIILDEPLIGLDPGQIAETHKLLRSLKKDHTLIISSHILSDIELLCDRAVLMNHGRLVELPEHYFSKTKIHPDEKIELIAQASRSALQKQLMLLPGVLNLERVHNENYAHFILETNDSTETRKRIFYLLSKSDWPIIELKGIKPGLEELFLTLTSVGAKEARR